MNFLKKKIKSVPKHIWILLAIICLGIFLRTYHFHDWLNFDIDQARDATLVGNVLNGKDSWPLWGPSMRGSGSSKDVLFHVGPIYNYFQIASAKVFGDAPDKMAYPDLFFSILSIPLFYFFLKKYFSVNLSLALTGLYAISYYAIRYSRFAWNPNPIPFFVLLFLSSLYEFLAHKEKTRWTWIISLGIALGVGIQLHAILLVLFSMMTFSVFIFLMIKNWRLWNKWLVIFLVVAFLNSGQIISEMRTNFANSKILIGFSGHNDKGGETTNQLTELENDIDCHLEANTNILTSLGQDTCSLSYIKAVEKNSITNPLGILIFWVGMILGILSSIFGLVLLIYHLGKEKEKEKRYFLGLITLYMALYFGIMFLLIDSYQEFRYFISTFFVPFIFLGLVINFLSRKYPQKYLWITVLIFLFFAISNISTTEPIAAELLAKSRSTEHGIILGEIEPMTNYLIDNAGNQKNIYFLDDRASATNFYKSFAYLAEKRNFNIDRINWSSKVSGQMSPGKPLFYIESTSKISSGSIDGYKIATYKRFGKIVIYKLDN